MISVYIQLSGRKFNFFPRAPRCGKSVRAPDKFEISLTLYNCNRSARMCADTPVRLPPRWLNLPLPLDIRRLIHRKLDLVDILMIEAAYFCDGPRWYCSYVYECKSSCVHYPDGSIYHTKWCRREHEGLYTEIYNSPPNCKWVELKVACARWNRPEMLSRAIAQYPQIHREHLSGHDVFYNAMVGNSVEFIHSHINTYKHGVHNAFYWSNLDAITTYIRADTSAETLRTLYSYGAIVNPECYRLALLYNNLEVADWCEEIASKCHCGRWTSDYFGACSRDHARKPEYIANRRTVAGCLIDNDMIESIIKGANIQTLEKKSKLLKPICLEFLPKYWLHVDPPANWLDVVKWVRDHGFDVRAEKFAKIYLVAAGFSSMDNKDTYQFRRKVDEQALQYLVCAGVPVVYGVRMSIMYRSIRIFEILLPGVPAGVNIDEEVAEYGTVKFISRYNFKKPGKSVVIALIKRDLYDVAQNLFSAFISTTGLESKLIADTPSEVGK